MLTDAGVSEATIDGLLGGHATSVFRLEVPAGKPS